MPPPTSKVWKFFKRCNDSKTVQCQLCEVELTYTRRDYKYAKPHQRMLDFLLDDNSEDNAESEITAFMRERADPDTDSLAWWKDNSDKHSRLSVLARRYLAVPSERIFSAAGLIVTKLRNRLSSSCIDQIIFLNKTLPQ